MATEPSGVDHLHTGMECGEVRAAVCTRAEAVVDQTRWWHMPYMGGAAERRCRLLVGLGCDVL
jgi:hypothetical protein